ncbi:MAG TPA: anti-sigma regulatory factor [Ruminiclostridium sp.]|jgi:serine/threonine-protein kinase RsbW|nr:anti-sigma regulatory factor [Clostridiaceae bacterium]HAA25059.1 anti-sigma regulatory factor [Ruminiclostridium sp.]
MKGNDTVTIHLPRKADYASLVRLAVSGIASKIGFDIDVIEDIKVAVSEVCNKIVSMDPESRDKYYDIIFRLFDDGLKVQFTVPGEIAGKMFEGESGEFAYAIISSLMDEFSVDCNGDCVITMGKNLGAE